MGERSTGARRRWIWATAFTVLPFALTAAYFGVGFSDDDPESSPVVQVLWAAWAFGSVGSAILAGVLGGFVRGTAAAALIWTAVVVLAVAVIGESCPLEMSAAPPPGTAAAAPLVLADETSCGYGDASYSVTAGWPLLGGLFMTLVTMAGGAIGAVARWALRRGPLPRAD